ncbi:MAG: hypothetical protein Q7U05_14520 [Polaromonas sp.]|nr:hypothetical protein [Polaromonas sp.]
MKTHTMIWLVCATCFSSLSAQVNAQPTEARQIDFMQPVSSTTLANYRGGASITNSEMTLSGLTSGNTAVNVVTGTNTIGLGAFSNMSGLPLVVQNSGANVLIQNAVILNLQMN